MVYFYGSESMPIRVNSFGLALSTLLALYRAFRARQNIEHEEKQILSDVFWGFNLVVVVTNFLAQMINTFVAIPYSAGILLFGMVAILLIAAITFCMIVFQIMDEQSHSTEQ